MKYGWRWFGAQDPVKIEDVMQVGATEVVSALHHLPNGIVWSIEEIEKRQQEVAWSSILGRETGLVWSVVESVPVHEDIKKRSGRYKEYIANYKQSLCNLSRCGIKTVIYNFMPVLDWTRTNLAMELKCGAKALCYKHEAFAAFDLFILQRKGAADDYSLSEYQAAQKCFARMSAEEKKLLERNIIAGLPGAEESFSIEEFSHVLASYEEIGKKELRENLLYFLHQVIPVAQEEGVVLAIHPDDPPRSILGLPRIMSNMEDVEWLLGSIRSSSNCLNLCAGSLGVNADNDLPQIMKKWGDRIPFVHLRTVRREGMDFYEDAHLGGSTDLFYLVKEVLEQEKIRKARGRADWEITMRPDHGWQMLDDLKKQTNPGYSCIGRMKGMAEIRGMATAIEKMNV